MIQPVGFETIEQFVVGKNPTQPCEDLLHVQPDSIGVIDGATSVEPCACCHPTPGHLAATTCRRVLEALPTSASFAQFWDLSQRTLQRQGKTRQCAGRHWSASLAVYRAARREIWTVGDVWVGRDGTFSRTEKLVDRVAAEMRAAVLRCELLAGTSVEHLLQTDEGRQSILPLLMRQDKFRNDTSAGKFEFSSWALSDSVPRLSSVAKLSPAATTVVLATDGYLNPRESLHESETLLNTRLKFDPLLIDDPPQTKGLRPGARSFDDRAYVKFRVFG